MIAEKRDGYSLLQILLHWLIAALVVLQLLIGEGMTNFVDARDSFDEIEPTDELLASIHYYAGLGILLFVLLRLLVRFIAGTPEPAGKGFSLVLAKAAHATFYALLIAVPATGLLAFYGYGPDGIGDIHGWSKPIFIGLITVHALAALFHQFWIRDDTLRRMIVPK